jgi:hypothetical protein
MVTNKKTNIPKYQCIDCDIKTNNKKDYEKHKLTAKHQKTGGGDTPGDKNIPILACSKCNKLYKSRNGLWKHSKICEYKPPENEPEPEPEPENEFENEFENNDMITLFIKENKDFKNIILDMVKNNSELQKQNQELQKQVLEVCKTSSSHINSHNTINSNNKNFNLNFFLNEQCKDAMNIMDFVNTFQLSLSDFERIGEVGYVEGISTIVIDKLNQMDIYKRPIHCSDAKRETMHVKDNGVWSKDSPTNDKIRLALKHITKKNTDLIRPWLNAHPGVLNSEHRLNDKYQEMFIEAMGGRKNKNMKEGEDKIIK